jgi:hypothetical protein
MKTGLIPGTPAEDHPDFLEWAICYRSFSHFASQVPL